MDQCERSILYWWHSACESMGTFTEGCKYTPEEGGGTALTGNLLESVQHPSGIFLRVAILSGCIWIRLPFSCAPQSPDKMNELQSLLQVLVHYTDSDVSVNVCYIILPLVLNGI